MILDSALAVSGKLNPTVYGEPVYPGYVYAPPPVIQPQPDYRNNTTQAATAGALGFGLGVVVGAALERHDWGWHAWGVDWGQHHDQRADNNDRPAVVYNNQTYVSRSETVINNNVRNVYNNGGPAVQSQPAQARDAATQARQMQQAQAQTQQSLETCRAMNGA